MDIALDDVYLAGRRRIDQRVRDLAVAGRSPHDIAVPACPGWSVHGVLSHLAAIPTDALAGRLTGIPDDAWTAGQVADRADRSTEEVLDEWAANAEAFAGVVKAMGIVPPALDVLTHEGDIAEALGDPAPSEEHWGGLLRTICPRMISGIDRPGALTVSAGTDTWSGGAGGEPVAAVTVPPWELFRGMLSRRSRAQMCAWEWTGDPEPWLRPLTVFGVREDDQPRAER